MKVYVITQGEYSDYHICGVAIDPDTAEAIRKHFSDQYDEAYINDYDTDDFKISCLKKRYVISISKSGENEGYFDFGTPVWGIHKQKNKFEFDKYGGFKAEVYAEDHDHALKIALDKRAKMLAEQLLV